MERSFVSILDDLDAGEVTSRLTDELKACVKGALKAQAKATLTLTLTVKPDGRMFIVTQDIKAKIPTPKTAQTAFYATDDGELRREDPKQVPLRHVPQKPTPLRSLEQPEAKTE